MYKPIGLYRAYDVFAAKLVSKLSTYLALQSRILVFFSAITNNPSCSSPSLQNFVYVIGQHAVQFGNNWLTQIPRAAKLDENFSNSINQFQFGQHVVLLRVNYIVHEVCSLLTVNLDSMKN